MRVISVQPETPGMTAFLEVPWRVCAGKVGWVPPIREADARDLDGSALFLALDGDDVVGRVAVFAPIQEDAHFSFFDVAEGLEIAPALLRAAEAWASVRGATRLVGPIPRTRLWGCGVQLHGQAESPHWGEARTPSWYAPCLERAGYRPILTWGAWDLPQQALTAWGERLGRSAASDPEMEQISAASVAEEAPKILHFLARSAASTEAIIRRLRYAPPGQYFRAAVGRQTVGLGAVLPDCATAFAAMNGDWRPTVLTRHPVARAVLALWVPPSEVTAGTGLARVLLTHTQAAGYRRAILSSPAAGPRFGEGFGPPSRSYALFARAITLPRSPSAYFSEA